MPLTIESQEPFVIFISNGSKQQQVGSKPVQQSSAAGRSETVHSASVCLEDPKSAAVQVVPTRFLTAYWTVTP